MSTYPNAIDNDATIPAVYDNIDQIGEEAINALRDAVFQIEIALGTNIAGTQPSLAARLGVFINQDGTPNTSILYNLGLVTLPVTNNQIANNAGIPESKLNLDFRTQDLYNYIRDLAKDVNLAIGWISVSGVKLEPHLIGAIYRHDLEQIDVAETSSQFLNNVFRTLRNNTNAYTLINDMNSELLTHQWADGSAFGTIQNITTNNGSIYPSNYAHIASGIYIDTSGFSVIPQTTQNVQSLAEYLDRASLLSIGGRLQSLFGNGISRNSQSSSLTADGYGKLIIPLTPAIAFLLGNTGNSSSPVDNINYGDDIIQLLPSSDDGYLFDQQFALVQPGDIITVNYSGDGYNVAVPYVILEKKFSYTPATNNNQTYIVRISGKNFAYAPNATAQINRSLFNKNKYGVLSVTGVNSPVSNVQPSLIVGAAKGAQCTGIGFSPDQFNESCYLLYLALYPNGNPLDGYTILSGIDVTGNQGTTPGAYTLQSIVQATNAAFRQPGFNYRFTAFQFEGEFGIMLADSYGNASFSVISAVMGPNGMYDPVETQINFPNNVVGVFPNTITIGSQTLPESTVTVNITTGFAPSGVISVTTATGVQNVTYTGLTQTAFTGSSGGTGTVLEGSAVTQPISVPLPDPLGFGQFGANLASPPYMTTIGWGSIVSALVPTRLFVPLVSNNFYVNGSELQAFPYDVSQAEDNYGDGYWVATITNVTTNAGPPGNVAVTYNIPLDLSNSGLQAGKTLIIQPTDGYNYGLVNYGRFFIQSVNFTTCAPFQTLITVYDAVHAQNGSPYPVAAIGSTVGVYFNASSVTFDAETATDFSVPTPYSNFKRHFEVYVDDTGNTYTHERGRFCTGGTTTVNSVTLYSSVLATAMDIVSISPKLRGYTFGSVTKINLYISNFNPITGQFVGNLQSYNGIVTRPGPTVTGRIGEITRFYDETNIDYIDIFFGLSSIPSSISGQFLDIQLFPSLALDKSIMIIASCQVNGTIVNQLIDLREFGNTSEEQLTTSAINFISAPDRLLHTNGVIRGFDTILGGPYGTAGLLSVSGGLALVNGNLNAVDDEIFIIPALQEYYESTYYPINYALCVNSDGDLIIIVLTDYDSVLGTPNNALNRIVTVLNVVSSTSYSIDSCNFSYLLNNRKDLTILYVVSSTVTGYGNNANTSISLRDVRRFINDSDSNIFATVTNDNSQGNFHNIQTSLNWLLFNNSFQNQLQIRGNWVLSTDPGFNNIPQLQVSGVSSNSILNATVPLYISGTTFNNITIIINSTLNIDNISGPTTFNNCNLDILNTSSNVTLQNCTFNNCTITVNALITVNSNCTFNNCIINATGGLPTAFSINSSSYNIQFTECNINYIPNTTSTSYNISNLINSGYGFIYSSVLSLQNILIDSCQFTTNVQTNSSVPLEFSGRFPFISFEYNDGYSVAQNINITNNKFYNTSSQDDIYAVIAFTCLLTSSQPAEGLKLIDCVIDNNICDKNQMISLSSLSVNSVINSLIMVSNLLINHNTCGTISATVGSNYTRNYEILTNGFGFGKQASAIITNNTCKFIGSLDGLGVYVDGVAYSTIAATTATAPLLIDGNTTSWISVAGSPISINSYDQVNGITISKNNVSAYNPNYLSSFFPSTIINGTSFYNSGITLWLGSVFTDTTYLNSNIIYNRVCSGNYLNSTGSTTTYAYSQCILDGHNGNINSNFVNGLITGSTYPMISADGTNNIVTNNYFYRNSTSITAYLAMANSSSIVNNNFFDSTTIDGTHTILVTGGATTRSVSQPLIYSIIAGTVNDTYGSFININGATDIFVKFTKLINHATLNSVIITYNNQDGDLTAPPVFTVKGGDGATQLGTVNGATPSGSQAATVNCTGSASIIDDSDNNYWIIINNPGSVDFNLYNIMLNFSNIISSNPSDI